MPYILEELYDKIYAADTMEQYQKVVQECMEKLETAGYGNIADKIRVLSEVYINRFSKQSTLENFEKRDLHMSEDFESTRSPNSDNNFGTFS